MRHVLVLFDSIIPDMITLFKKVVSDLTPKILFFFLRSTFLKVFIFLKNYIYLASFPILNLNRLSNNDIYQLSHSEVFNYFKANGALKERPRSFFRREWTRLAWLAMEGKCKESNMAREVLLLKARAQYGLSEEFTPNIMERGWTTHYGHLGALIKYRDAQKLGLVASGRRLVVRSHRYSYERPIFRLLRESFDFMGSTSPTSVFDVESLFPLTEKVTFMRTSEGYQDLFQFYNLVGERQSQQWHFKRETFRFSEVEQELIFQKLYGFNIDPKQPFVALHIRDTGDKYASRDSIAENFIPSIREIINRGMPVLRIGSLNNSPLPQIPGLIDFKGISSEEEQLLSDFAISNCEYFISSQSGPAGVAHALGVPTLIVDAVAIACSSYTTAGLSMTLPKPWLDSTDRQLSYEEIFGLGLGACQLSQFKGGYHLRNNSSEEILFAVREFSNFMKHPSRTRDNPSDFRALKKSVGGYGDGMISELYFINNPK